YRFALAEAAGSAIFVPAMATLGFLFSDRAELVARDVGRVQHWLVLLGLLALALYLGLRAWIGRTGLGGEGPVTGDPPRGGRDDLDLEPRRNPGRQSRLGGVRVGMPRLDQLPVRVERAVGDDRTARRHGQGSQRCDQGSRRDLAGRAVGSHVRERRDDLGVGG